MIDGKRNGTADERRFTRMDPAKIGVYRRASAVRTCWVVDGGFIHPWVGRCRGIGGSFARVLREGRYHAGKEPVDAGLCGETVRRGARQAVPPDRCSR